MSRGDGKDEIPQRPASGRSEAPRTALRTREVLQLVLDSIPVRVFWKDLESVYLGCNLLFAADAGLDSPAEIVGRNDFELSWRKQAELYRGDDRQVMQTGEPKINYEEPQTWEDGTELWLRTSKVPLRDHEGRVVGVMGCYEDITERKRSDRTLSRYEHIVAASRDHISFVDRELVYRAVNDAYVEAFGRPREEIVNRPVREIHGEEAFERIIRGRLVQCLAGEHLHYQHWVDFPVSGRRFMDVRMSPHHEREGGVSGVVVSARDITERRRAEEERRLLEAQIQHTQKLESLGILAGGIAHDFNNLLTGILGNAGLAARTVREDSQTAARLRDIETASLRAAELCRQLLAYSGKGRFVVEPIDLTREVEEMAHLLEVSISKKASLRRNFEPELPAVEADSTQVRQVIMNLITNASDALEDKEGMIAIATGRRSCNRDYLSRTYVDDDLSEGEYVYLEVADTGCGMSRETRARLFDPFFTTKFTGRGLGMAAVLGIVRGHGGAIRVQSEEGRGTIVSVLFPASERPLLAPPARETVSESWRGEGTVLVVDDEVAVLEFARHVLESAGFHVVCADDGHAALEIFTERSSEFAAVLLDLTMPRISGEETLQRLREIRKDIPVILSSGYNEQEVTRRFAGHSLSGFLQKPYRPNDLLASLRTLLDP